MLEWAFGVHWLWDLGFVDGVWNMGLMEDFGTDFAERFSKHLARFFSQCLNKPRMWAKKIFCHFCGFLYPQNGVVKPFCFFWKYSFFALKKSFQILSFQNFVAWRYVIVLVSAGEMFR